MELSGEMPETALDATDSSIEVDLQDVNLSMEKDDDSQVTVGI